MLLPPPLLLLPLLLPPPHLSFHTLHAHTPPTLLPRLLRRTSLFPNTRRPRAPSFSTSIPTPLPSPPPLLPLLLLPPLLFPPLLDASSFHTPCTHTTHPSPPPPPPHLPLVQHLHTRRLRAPSFSTSSSAACRRRCTCRRCYCRCCYCRRLLLSLPAYTHTHTHHPSPTPPSPSPSPSSRSFLLHALTLPCNQSRSLIPVARIRPWHATPPTSPTI